MPSEREEFAQLAGCSTDRTWLADLLTLRLKEEPGNPLARPILTDAQWQTVIAALRAQDREDGAAFAIDARVRKVTGDYHLDGIVVGHATMTTGARRYVVEHRAEGGGSFLHIYAEANLVALPLSTRTEVGDA